MRIVALSFLLVLLSCSTQAAETSLTVTVGGETRNFTREALLARSDAATIEVSMRGQEARLCDVVEAWRG